MKTSHAGSIDGDLKFLAVIAALSIVWGVVIFIRGFRDLKKRRAIENTPTSKIRSAAMGLVEIVGEACGPYTLTSPLTLAPCYFYQLIVKRRVKKSWRIVQARQRCIPFYLKDETGMMLVDARHATPQLPTYQTSYDDPNYVASVDEPVPVPSISAFSTSVSLTDVSSESVAEEQCICEGQTLYALGVLAENTEIKVQDPGPSLPLVAGSVQEQILEAAVHAAATKPAPALEKYDLAPRSVLCGTPERPLFLSSRSQRELISELAFSSALKILGGPVITLGAITYLLWYLNR